MESVATREVDVAVIAVYFFSQYRFAVFGGPDQDCLPSHLQAHAKCSRSLGIADSLGAEGVGWLVSCYQFKT